MRRRAVVVLLLLGALCFSETLSFRSRPQAAEVKVRVRREKVPDAVIFESLQDREKEYLSKFRQKNPGKFGTVLQRKIKKRRAYLSRLKKKDPERFREIVDLARERIRERLETLRKEDPEKFNRMAQRAVAGCKERFERLCAQNPQKCSALISRYRPCFQKRLEELDAGDLRRYRQAIEELQERGPDGETEKSVPDR